MQEKKKMIWAGFDVGKETFSASLDQVTENGKAKITSLPCRDFKRTPEGLTKFFQWADGIISGMDLHIVMETTGCYSQQFIESLNLPHKTDKLDAQAIARFGAERQPHPTKRPSKTILTIRELSRERTALIKNRVDLQNRRDTITSSVVRKINAQTIATLTMQIEKIEQEIKACIVEDEEILTEIHIMTTMPGVKFVSAYSILAEIGSLKQYSIKELSAISGLAPRIRQSGSSVHSSFMSRRSSGRLRQILYLDSLPGVPKIPVLQDFQQRLLAKGKKKMTVRCACMRKMLMMMRSMVVHNSPFDENFLKNFSTRT